MVLDSEVGRLETYDLLKETNAADILNQVNKVALEFSVVRSREGLYPRGNFSTTSSSKQFFLSLAKYKLLYTS